MLVIYMVTGSLRMNMARLPMSTVTPLLRIHTAETLPVLPIQGYAIIIDKFLR